MFILTLTILASGPMSSLALRGEVQVSFAEYRLFHRALLQKRPIILSILLIEARILHLALRWERWGDGVDTQQNVRGEVGGWGRVPFNEPYAPSLSTIYDGA